MKFIHAADIHLDSPLRGLARHEGAPTETIRGATRQAFENMVELALEERVDFLLLAGDLYDGTWQDFSTGIFLARKLGELERAGIPVFSVVGNHDHASKITKALEKPKNLTVFPSTKPKTEILPELGVAIHGQSFGRQQVDENLAAGFPAAKAGMFNIGLLHTSLDGREGHAKYAPCKLGDLRSKDYQYWALGHVHQRETVSEEPWVVFPGCLQGRHARETGPKGCCLVSVEDGQVASVEWRELDVVRWTCCEVDLAEAETLDHVQEACREALRDALDAAGERTLAVRIRFVGASPVHRVVQGRAHWLKNRVVELAAELGGDDLWIEKVKVETSIRLDRDALLAGDSSLGGLVRAILDVGETMEDVPGLGNVVDKLKAKLPPEILSGEGGLDVERPEVMARLIREAKEMLLDRLLEAGSEP